MAKFRVTIPVYYTVTVEALDYSDAFEKAVVQPGNFKWERDDPQPDLEEFDANIELDEGDLSDYSQEVADA